MHMYMCIHVHVFDDKHMTVFNIPLHSGNIHVHTTYSHVHYAIFTYYVLFHFQNKAIQFTYPIFSQDNLFVKSLNSHCPQCEIDVPRVPNRMELIELTEEIRHMMIKSEKISYWRQFEHGVLSREAVRVLINLADTVLDTPDRYMHMHALF